MNDSEELAYAYLKWLGFKSVEFEPEGQSKVPDFLVDGRIAVEARRLNQNRASTQPGMKVEGLEKRRIAIWDDIERLLPSLGPPSEGVSWYVFFQFKRPVPKSRRLTHAVRDKLQALRDSEGANPTTIVLFENFNLELLHTGKLYSQRFVMGGCGDHDSGGWVIPELERNLQICVNEKTTKIAPIFE
ncbi:MAG: hypothetical protein ACRD4P_02395 [Bryobacteraceae bacterium]